MLAETICSAVSAAGLGIAAVTAYRKRFLAATRIAAYALVPVALVLTGFVEWVSGMVFKPSVWLGFGLLGLSWVLFMTTRAIERRGLGAGEKPSKAAKAAKGSPGQAAVAPAASTPTPGRSASAQPAPRQSAATPADDFSDIEAILKKHGI
ncbi:MULTISPECIES: membrane protein [unclassified Streptomyces]|uniref:membrane protein n=1 Tax=unclassified Streptomyces TaxID=2593676 RepID=UPI0004CB615A|nr:membrane protein [Streptomyces sp. NRRL F-2747]